VTPKAEELLHNANAGDKAAHSKILELLSGIQAQGDFARAEKITNPPIPPLPKPRRPQPYPGAKPLLEQLPRPKSKLTGRRHVPVLVNANLFPFLRIKKPQSPFLSRVLNDKIIQRQKRRDNLDAMEGAYALARDEQEWDIATGMAEWPAWTTAIDEEVSHIERQILESRQKNAIIASRMLDIVDEEQRLADIDKKDYFREKRKRYRRRRDEREAALRGELPK
jgi:hypothetical protein